MLIQNKYDLKLIGNSIVDETYLISNWAQQGTSNSFIDRKISVGGIGNIVKAIDTKQLKIIVETCVGNDSDANIIINYFKGYPLKVNYHHSNKATSRALIISSLQDKERTSFVNWGAGNEIFAPFQNKSRWTHICYLDTLTNLDIKNIRNNSDVVSADLCLSSPNTETIEIVLNNLQYLDYLFISESEINSYFKSTNIKKIQKIIKQYKLKSLIFHQRNGTKIIRNNFYQEIIGNHTIMNNIDVLGAGDAYCANFILYHLNNENNDEKAALYAHLEATNFLTFLR